MLCLLYIITTGLEDVTTPVKSCVILASPWKISLVSVKDLVIVDFAPPFPLLPPPIDSKSDIMITHTY